MSFGYSVLGFGAHPSRGTPFAAVIDDGMTEEVIVAGIPTGSEVTFTTNSGEIDMAVTATGGDGNYIYSWSMSEDDDPDAKWSIASNGTTNTARWDTATLNGARPPTQGEHIAVYTASCRVQDGSGGDITLSTQFICIGASE